MAFSKSATDQNRLVVSISLLDLPLAMTVTGTAYKSGGRDEQRNEKSDDIAVLHFERESVSNVIQALAGLDFDFIRITRVHG